MLLHLATDAHKCHKSNFFVAFFIILMNTKQELVDERCALCSIQSWMTDVYLKSSGAPVFSAQKIMCEGAVTLAKFWSIVNCQ